MYWRQTSRINKQLLSRNCTKHRQKNPTNSISQTLKHPFCIHQGNHNIEEPMFFVHLEETFWRSSMEFVCTPLIAKSKCPTAINLYYLSIQGRWKKELLLEKKHFFFFFWVECIAERLFGGPQLMLLRSINNFLTNTWKVSPYALYISKRQQGGVLIHTGDSHTRPPLPSPPPYSTQFMNH